MKLNDFDPRFRKTKHVEQIDEAAPMEKSLVKIPGMGIVHIDALVKNIAIKVDDLAKKVATGDPNSIQEAHRLMHGPAFNAMFDALINAYADLEPKRRK